MYDGLTDIDSSDPANPEIKPLSPSRSSPTRTPRCGRSRSARAWPSPTARRSCRARSSARGSGPPNPEFAGDYSYLMNFIEGGAEKLAGEADTLAGVVADDDGDDAHRHAGRAVLQLPGRRRLPAVLPDARGRRRRRRRLRERRDDRQRPVHARGAPGPTRRSSSSRTTTWTGDINGETWPDRLDRITFLTPDRPGHGVQRAGGRRGRHGQHPAGPGRRTPGRTGAPRSTSRSSARTTSYFNDRDPSIGGEANLQLRQAISQAIDREEINEAVYNGIAPTADRHHAAGHPRVQGRHLRVLRVRPRGAPRRCSTSGPPPATRQAAPLKIQFNAGAGHEDVVAIIIENLAAIGIQAEADPRPTETYFTRDGRRAVRVLPGGLVRRLPDVRQLHVRPVPHRLHSVATTTGFINPEFDAPRRPGQADRRPGRAGRAVQPGRGDPPQRGRSAVPINWYLGDYAYNQEKISNFTQTNFGSDHLGAGHAGRLSRSQQACGGGALPAPPPPALHHSRSRHGQLHHPPVLLLIPTSSSPSRSSSSSSSSCPATRRRCSPAAATGPSIPRSSSGRTPATGSTTRSSCSSSTTGSGVLQLGPRRVVRQQTAASTTSSARRRRAASGWPSGRSLIEIVIGISVGLISAIRRYSLSDKLTTIGTAAAAAIPAFVLGFILQYAFAVYPNQHDWPEWMQLRTSAPRPRHVGGVLHPDRRAVALPDPAGDHAGLRVDGAGGAHDARLDARGDRAPTTCARRGRRACRSGRSSCATACATP